MKIGIESQRIFRKDKHGMDVVAMELIRQIQALDKKNEYLLFAKNGEDRGCIHDTENFKTAILNGVTYAGWEQISLPAAAKKYNLDLLHCTTNTAPYSSPVPMIITVHDVIYLEETNFKGSAYQNFGNLYRKLVVPHAIKTAEKIITVSEYEKTVIVDVCKIDPDKISVIHNGVSERFNQLYTEEDIKRFRLQWKLPDRFILFHGNTAPKKNTAGVIKAYAHYCTIVHDPLQLVITDFPQSAIRSILHKINKSDLTDKIITPGYIPSSQMPLMYNCSSLFLYPSLRESFGLPVLEAMSCGIPVIASDIPALREVGGEAASFIDPEDAVVIAEKIQLMSTDQQIRNDFIQKGLIRVKLFKWETAAHKLIKLYESI